MSAVGRLLRRMAVGKAASLESPYVFPHTAGPNVGEPIRDIKNGFHKAMKLAGLRASPGTTSDTRSPHGS